MMVVMVSWTASSPYTFLMNPSRACLEAPATLLLKLKSCSIPDSTPLLCLSPSPSMSDMRGIWGETEQRSRVRNRAGLQLQQQRRRGLQACQTWVHEEGVWTARSSAHHHHHHRGGVPVHPRGQGAGAGKLLGPPSSLPSLVRPPDRPPREAQGDSHQPHPPRGIHDCGGLHHWCPSHFLRPARRGPGLLSHRCRGHWTHSIHIPDQT